MQSRARAGHERGRVWFSEGFFLFFFSFFCFFPVGSDLRDLRYLSGMKEGITPRRGEREREKANGAGGKREKGLKLEAKPEVGERSTNPPRTGSKELRVFFSTIKNVEQSQPN
jgi:hypothetical protein